MNMFKNKKGKFFNYASASLTPTNTFFFVVVLFVLVYGISYLLNQIFGTRVISVGTPFRFLILAMALVISFYLVIKRQGVLERKDIFLILLLGGGLVTLFIYLPQIFPEVFKSTANSVLATDPNSPFVIISDVARSTHSTVQSIIPIP